MQVFALGLGELQTHSALNQPFDAELEIIATQPSELRGLEVKLASPEDFSRAGIERVPVLNALRFRVERKNGRAYVHITSRQAILEPYLNFLVEVNWSRGRLLREFTVLLDPPELLGGEAAGVESPETSERMVPAAPPKVVGRAAARTGAAEASFPVVYGPIEKNEKLWNIAKEIRGDMKVTIPQVMMALLRNNPEAFIDNNVNRVKSGFVLRIDNLQDIYSMTPAEARAEFQHQYQVWLDYKQQRAMAAETRRREQEIAGKIRRGETGGKAQPQTDKQGVLTLVRPEGEKPIGGHLESGAVGQGQESEELNRLRQQLADAQQSAELNQKQNEAMHERLKAMEDQITALQRLMAVRSDELTSLQQQLESGAEAPKAAEAAAGEHGESSFFDYQHLSEKFNTLLQHLRENPQMMGIIGGATFLFLTTLWLLLRRRKQGELDQYSFEQPAADSGFDMEMEEPWESSAELREGIAEAWQQKPAEAEEMEEDPITQADIFIAYGNLDAAIEVMESAVNKWPDHGEYQRKLAELKDRRAAAAPGEESSDLLASDVQEPPSAAVMPMAEEEEALLTDEDLLAFQEEMESSEPEPAGHDEIHSAMSDFGIELGEDHDLKIDHDLDELTKESSAESGLEFDLSDIHSELEQLTTEEGLQPASEHEQAIAEFDLQELAEEGTEQAAVEQAVVEPEPAPVETMQEEAPSVEAVQEQELEPDFDTASLIELEDHAPDLLNDVDEVGTKLDLARAYIDMGDPEGARSILEEVLNEGNEHQIQEANGLLGQIQ